MEETDISHGGWYQCMAENYLGKDSRTRRIDIVGPPFVKKMKDLSFIATNDVRIQCPYRGYPISQVVWKKGGRLIIISVLFHFYS